jgi:hypothetical protein
MLCGLDPFRYRSQGVRRTSTAKPASYSLANRISVNGQNSQPSDFAIAAILVYSRELSFEEVLTMEDHLSSLYGIALERGPKPPVLTSLTAW